MTTRFVRIPGTDQWREEKAEAKLWNPNAASAIRFRADTFALLFQADPDFPGWHIIVLLSRPSPAVDWTTVQDGTLLSSPWPDAIARAGGWAPWITATVDAANAAIHRALGDSSPIVPVSTLPAGTPATWDECVDWLRANLWVADTAASSNIFAGPKPVEPSQPIPGPAPGVREVFGDREFLDGYATERGLRIHPDGRVERIERINLDGWKPLLRGN